MNRTTASTSDATNEIELDPSLESVSGLPSAGAQSELAHDAMQSDELDPASQALTAPFVGRWQTLISQTNWEKGRIISEWRSALIAENATPTKFSDETWAKQVGAVTGQHVGRLRRVFERFGSNYTSYQGLYWSHFLAALDWDDAELWLEGASRSDWSISQMRKTRWESMGSNPTHAPKDEELITSELDDDFDALLESDDQVESDREENDRIGSTGSMAEGPDFGDADDAANEIGSTGESAGTAVEETPWDETSEQQANPFLGLPELPPDVADALEQFKLCVVRHRASQWSDISQKSLLEVLDALKSFVAR